ncbi:Retrovirus-related Pol polyprotein from transposon 17.6, partial [Mucuna pruriens]
MVALFHDMMHKEVEVYVDDMIAKSKTDGEHIQDLRKLFERLRKYGFRLNPAKCTFSVKSGKLLGFIVNEKGIEVDPNKKTEWIEDYQKAFKEIKRYLKEPPILVPPVFGRPLIMYLIVLEESMGYVLGQHDESKRKEWAIYYLSKKFTNYEMRYSQLERTYCALT